MSFDHAPLMRVAIAEAELARGHTGDNPWVGCVIVDAHGAILARGRTQGPGEDHAEAAAVRSAESRGIAIAGTTLYSTLEPCAFHGRTPACARTIVDRGFARVVIGMHDPHPRVDGEGTRILRAGGIEVITGVCEDEVRHQLGVWVSRYHPHEPRARAAELLASRSREDVVRNLADIYGLDESTAAKLVP